MLVEAQPREFRDAKLFAQNPLGVIALENPVFQAAFNSAGSFEQGSFRGFK